MITDDSIFEKWILLYACRHTCKADRDKLSKVCLVVSYSGYTCKADRDKLSKVCLVVSYSKHTCKADRDNLLKVCLVLDPSTELASATSHVPTAVPAQIL
jgi:hypothetical protein